MRKSSEGLSSDRQGPLSFRALDPLQHWSNGAILTTCTCGRWRFARHFLLLTGCSDELTLPPVGITASTASYENSSDYRLGPGDVVNVVVWHNTDLSSQVPVRPDGRISMPLLGDVVAAGKTPMDLAKEIKDKLKPYVKDPLVTVTPTPICGPIARQVRCDRRGGFSRRAVPYSSNMTLLDVMIAVGGLTRYADGDRR